LLVASAASVIAVVLTGPSGKPLSLEAKVGDQVFTPDFAGEILDVRIVEQGVSTLHATMFPVTENGGKVGTAIFWELRCFRLRFEAAPMYFCAARQKT